VVLAVIVIFLVSTLSSGTSAGQPIAAKPVPSAVLDALTHATPAQFAAAGTGGSQVAVKGVFTATPQQAALTKGGKPVLLYGGAEYCPYCAASRWPLIIALSRFGTFTGLQTIGSSPYDVYANTHTFTFLKASYTSKYLVFEPTEFESNECASKPVSGSCPNSVYKPLQTMSKANAKLYSTYDTTTYFPEGTTGGIPFLDWGGRYVSQGVVYSPNVINAGNSTNAKGWTPMTWDQIVAALKNSSTTQAQAIFGGANVYTAAICEMTHNAPRSVCSTPVIAQVEKELPTS
jgi:hypothetical protein